MDKETASFVRPFKPTNMKNHFLGYYKMILEKVSFNTILFHKEYNKALQVLSPDEVEILNGWLKARGLSVESTGHRSIPFMEPMAQISD
jgi:hypothetical protein